MNLGPVVEAGFALDFGGSGFLDSAGFSLGFGAGTGLSAGVLGLT